MEISKSIFQPFAFGKYNMQGEALLAGSCSSICLIDHLLTAVELAAYFSLVFFIYSFFIYRVTRIVEGKEIDCFHYG